MHLRFRPVCVQIASVPLLASCSHHHLCRNSARPQRKRIARVEKKFPRLHKQKEKEPEGGRTGVTTTTGLLTVAKSPAQLTNNLMGIKVSYEFYDYGKNCISFPIILQTWLYVFFFSTWGWLNTSRNMWLRLGFLLNKCVFVSSSRCVIYLD